MCQQVVELLRLEAPDLVPKVVDPGTLADALMLLSQRRALAQQVQEDRAWRRWFARLPEEKRQALADKARQAGLSNPESFEAAWGIILGEHAASLLTPEELASMDSEEGIELTQADLERWAETGELPWDASSS